MSMLTDVQAVKGRFHWGNSTAWRTPGGNVQVSAHVPRQRYTPPQSRCPPNGHARPKQGRPAAGCRGKASQTPCPDTLCCPCTAFPLTARSAGSWYRGAKCWP